MTQKSFNSIFEVYREFNSLVQCHTAYTRVRLKDFVNIMMKNNVPFDLITNKSECKHFIQLPIVTKYEININSFSQFQEKAN